MRLTSTALAAAALVALLVFTAAAQADALFPSSVLTKQGVSGQVYAWQSGSC